MQVEDGLAGGSLVELHDRYPVGVERFLGGDGDFLDCGDQRRQACSVGIEKIARRGFGHDQHVAFSLRHHVHEGDRRIVLVDPV
ncbi:hypothetical protein D3C80_2113480 [compost metagenome]